MDIYTALMALVDEITELGIPATLDPRDLEAPGAIVELAEIGGDNILCGAVAARANVYLVAPNNGRPIATQTLLNMYDKVADLTTGAQTADLALPDTSPLPALKLNAIELF